MLVRIAGITPASQVNGPGTRAVVHFQGCTLACPGCFNPHTHPVAGGEERPVASVAEELAGLAAGLDGVTISGGEPFEQPEALAALAAALKEAGVSTILVFTGFTLAEIDSDAARRAALDGLDVLVAGRYEVKRPASGSVLASNNQRAHFLTAAYGPEDLELDRGEVEITISPDGDVRVTGFPSAALRKGLKSMG